MHQANIQRKAKQYNSCLNINGIENLINYQCLRLNFDRFDIQTQKSQSLFILITLHVLIY